MSADLTPLLHQLLLAAQQLNAQSRARADMTPSEYAGLQHLAHSSDGLTPGQLGSRLAITSGSITKLIDRLEARRLARRIRHPHGDRRSLTVIATQKGKDLIHHDLTHLLDHLPPPRHPLTPAQHQTVARLIATLDHQTQLPDQTC